jgi:gluconolactonase
LIFGGGYGAWARYREKRMRVGDFEILDDRFKPLVKVAAKVEKLFEGCRWAEGPAYFPAHRYLV